MYMTNGINHWILRQLTRSTKADPWPGDRSPICNNQWSPPQSSSKKGWRATNSCFTFIGAPQLLLTWSVGVISSDYCHLSFTPNTGLQWTIPISARQCTCLYVASHSTWNYVLLNMYTVCCATRLIISLYSSFPLHNCASIILYYYWSFSVVGTKRVLVY